jgi:hypothetical protein
MSMTRKEREYVRGLEHQIVALREGFSTVARERDAAQDELRLLKTRGSFVNDDAAMMVARMIEANAALTEAFARAMSFDTVKTRTPR